MTSYAIRNASPRSKRNFAVRLALTHHLRSLGEPIPRQFSLLRRTG